MTAALAPTFVIHTSVICHLPSAICHLHNCRPTITRFDPARTVPGDWLWNRAGGCITMDQVTPVTRRVS